MLSIVIPALNEAVTIEATLARLQALRRDGAEVVVVDGGSTDDTTRLASPLADLATVAPRGRAAQMNAGASQARGDQLLFLHADTILPEDARRIIEVALGCTDRVWGRFDVTFDSPKPLLGAVAFMMNLRSRWTGIATGDQAIFMQRAAFERVGGFPRITLMEDIAISRALNRLSRPVCIKAKVTTSGRRWEENGIIRTIVLMWRLRLEYFFGVDPSKLATRYADARRRG